MSAFGLPRKVVVLQSRLLHYRVGMFERLRVACADRNIEFHLVHGQPTARELTRRDCGALAWADVVTNRYIDVGGRDIPWQPFPAEHRDAALVVLMQENRLLSNYPWLLRGKHQKARIAYWGHGRNLQSAKPHGLRERWKKLLVGRVDWWFAYTQMTRDILLRDGYPDARLTVLDNAIDNDAFERDLAAVSDEDIATLRVQHGMGATPNIGVFCGSLYPDKRLGFLVEAADRIRAALPDFALVVIGDGPSAGQLRVAAASRPWLHSVGAQQGRGKAAWFRVAAVMLNPGSVGLHVLDSFCAGVPMVTTAEARHGPEIAYLEHRVNGMVVRGGPAEYAAAVVALLRDGAHRTLLGARAHAAATRYTLTNMVNNFANGIDRCLAMEKVR